jgi:DNA replication ATP-dependent helicase Dna2
VPVISCSSDVDINEFEQVLLLQDESTKMSKAVMLRQSWYDSPCTTGSYIHLIGDFDGSGHCIVDDAHHMIILHPDHLVSATVVADSFTCMRRAVLQDRIKATSETTRPLMYGSILHEVFQEALKANLWDLGFLKTTIEEVVSCYLEKLFELNLSVPEAVDYLMSKMPEMKAWAEVFVTANPKVRIPGFSEGIS